MFLLARDADGHEDERQTVIALGHLRDRGREPLSARELVRREWATPGRIAPDGITGHGTVVSLGRQGSKRNCARSPARTCAASTRAATLGPPPCSPAAVDSSVIQLIVGEAARERPRRSFSFAVEARSFQSEIKYAEEAAQLLRTEHTFVPVTADHYPGAYRVPLRRRLLRRLDTEPLLKGILHRNGLGSIADKRKLGSNFHDDLLAWMKTDPLAERVRAMERPEVVSPGEFAALLDSPSMILWLLFTWDLFVKDVPPDLAHRRAFEETAALRS